jgi:hypothetical protein
VTAPWPVLHRCGHSVEWDLSKKHPGDRAGFARWLAERDCTRCWWANRRAPHTQNRAVRNRLRQALGIANWERSTRMPPMTGRPKAVAWARKIRHRVLTAASKGASAGSREHDDEVQRDVETCARSITAARWWIDHRNLDPRDLAKTLKVASAQRTTPRPGDRTRR